MASFDEIWTAATAHEDTKLAPPASADAITAFEARHGFTLPPSHREFLLRANGGVVGYARLFGVGGAVPFDLDQAAVQMQPYIGGIAEGRVYPFANDWGGSYFCYDLQRPRPDGEYPVLLWNHEYAEEPEDRPMLWSEFAPTFEAFVRDVIT